MTNSFLHQLALKIHEQFGENIDNIALVFPTKRARIFFVEQLATVYKSTIWSPKIYSIEEFIRETYTGIFPETIHLIFELYEVYLQEMRKKVPTYTETFDQFYAWGEMLLADFNEVDKNYTDAKQLYRNIRELREIEIEIGISEELSEAIRRFWNTINAEEPTKLQSDFLAIWEILYDVYKKFTDRLSENNWAYEGMAHRATADKILAGEMPWQYDFVVFAGLNALSNSESIIIEGLLKKKKAVIYWDVDAYYYKDREGAGKYIAQQHEKWKKYQSHLIENRMEDEKKEIFIVGVPQHSGQAKYVGERIASDLQKMFLGGEQAEQAENSLNLRNRVIILGDENLLFPTLYALPKKVKRLNITMGFPLKYTNIYHLLMSITKLVRNMRNESSENPVFHYKSLMEILQNPFVKSSAPEDCARLQRTLAKDNVVYITANYLKSKEIPDFLKEIFTPPKKETEVMNYFENIFLALAAVSEEAQMPLESEYIYFFYRQFNQLKAVIGKYYDTPLTLRAFAMTFRESMRRLRIPFEGEPLEGLQIMGLLESRVLDFEYVYILGVNDDTLPGSSNNNTFIPNTLRSAYKIDTFEDKDTIFSYHFYRLIQRAKEVHLVYNSQVESAGEVSRFILQLRHAFENHPNIHITERKISTTSKNFLASDIHIPMNAEIQRKLRQRFDANTEQEVEMEHTPYLSATAMSDYLTCSLRFYFKYVAKLREKSEISEEIDPLTFGKLLHEVMQYLYEPLKNMLLSKEEFLFTIKGLPEAIRHVFDNNGYKETEGLYGRNYLFQDIIKKLCKKIIHQDAEDAPFVIEYIEQRGAFGTLLAVEDMQIRLDGNFDRMDKMPKDSSYRIIDYKTGETDVNDQPIADCFEPKKFKSAVLQGYLYAYLFSRRFKNKQVRVGYYSVKNLKNGAIYLKAGSFIEDKDNETFEEELKKLVKRIFTEDFVQTHEHKHCEYCTFKQICNR